MNAHTILPYYYPTTVCFVDDNASYLESLIMHMPRNWPHRVFYNGIDALAHINRADRPAPLAERCLRPVGTDTTKATQFSLDLGLIEQEIARPNRFEDTSVILVDYAMPTMDGLEVCAKINDPHARIVLLTGVADEATAVQAFNAGLIHKYIRKGKTEQLASTFVTIEEMRHQYLEYCSTSLFSGLRAHPDSYRNDSHFQVYFRRLIDTLNITEYYLVTDPDGYMLIDLHGQFLRLVVLEEKDLQAQQRLMAAYQAPADIQRRCAARAQMGYFYEHPSDYGAEPYPWHDMMIDVEPIQSADAERTWYAGIHPHPPIDIDFDLSQSSLDHYLDHLDPLTGKYTERSSRAAHRQAALKQTE